MNKKLIGMLAIPAIIAGVAAGAIATSQAHAASQSTPTPSATVDKAEPGDTPDSQDKETPGQTDTDTETND